MHKLSSQLQALIEPENDAELFCGRCGGRKPDDWVECPECLAEELDYRRDAERDHGELQ